MKYIKNISKSFATSIILFVPLYISPLLMDNNDLILENKSTYSYQVSEYDDNTITIETATDSFDTDKNININIVDDNTGTPNIEAIEANVIYVYTTIIEPAIEENNSESGFKTLGIITASFIYIWWISQYSGKKMKS